MSEKEFSTDAIESVELKEESGQELSTLSSLHEISKSLLSEYDLQKLLDIIAENAMKVLEADLVTLYEYNREKDDVELPPIIKGKAIEIEVLRERGMVVSHKESITFKMIKRKKPFYAENAKEDWVKEGIIPQESVERKDSFFNREMIVSSAGIPLCIDEDVVGVLFVNYRSSQRFSPEHKERIEIFANYAALAIRNVRIFSKSQQYVKQLSVLNEIGKKISSASTMDIDEMLFLVYEQTQSLMDVSNFYIAFYDEKNDTVHFKIAIEDGRRQKVGEREYSSRKGGHGLTEYIIREKKPLLLSRDAEKWIHSQKKVEGIGKPTKSWLGAPMIIEGKILGVIGVQNYDKENVYNEDHLKVLTTIASQTAIAISKANVFMEAKTRLHELEALYDISKEIAGKTLDIKSVLQTIVKRAVELCNAQGGAIYLCDKPRKDLKAVVTYKSDKLMGVRIEFDTGMAGRVATTGKPMIQNDYHSWNGKASVFNKEKYKNLFKAVAEVPLKSGGEVIGVLAMSSLEENYTFTGDDIRLLERFAGHAAIAINNARTHSYLQTLVGSTPDAVIAVDQNGIIKKFNPASEEILKYSAKEVIGKSVTELYWGGLSEAMKVNLWLRKNEKIKNLETYVKNKEGVKIPIRIAGALLYDEIGEWVGSVGHMEDMREIRLLEDKYRALYEVGKVAVEVPEYDMRKICQVFTDVLTRTVLHFKASYVCLKNEENELELMAVGGTAEGYNILRRVKRIFSNLIGAKDTIHIKNVHKDNRFNYLQCAKEDNIYSSLVRPLIVKGNEIGEITVFKGEESEFSEKEKEFLERFASQAALVIDKARDVDRSKKISEALQRITYDIIELSGEDIYGDILDKMTTIIDANVASTYFCLYKCDADDDKSAILIESSSENLRSILKSKISNGESPFKSEKDANSDYIFLQTRSYGHSGRLEGFLVFEKVPIKDGSTAQFTEVDRLIISMVASAVGVALFRLRRHLQQNSAMVIEENNTRKVG